MRLILNDPIPFLDLEEKGYAGDTLLLQIARLYNFHDHLAAKLDLVLDKGANVHARNSGGKNCLRLLFENISLTVGIWEYGAYRTLWKCLILLINYGADVASTDNHGRSVSEYVYRSEAETSFLVGLGDMWDAVLSRYGHDIRQMRKGFHRLSTYETRTSDGRPLRDSFKTLWTNREKHCPYYHDPPVWCPEGIPPLWLCPFGQCPYRKLRSGEKYYRCPGLAGFRNDRPCGVAVCPVHKIMEVQTVGELEMEDRIDSAT